jgi:regulatory protein
MRKPVSSKQLAFGLKQKGVSKEVIEETISNLNENETDASRAVRAAEKRWPRILKSESDPRKQKQKLYTFLAGRGFSFETINEVYGKLAKDKDVEEG